MTMLNQVRFKTRRDVLGMTIGDGQAAISLKMLPPTKEMHDDMLSVVSVLEGRAEADLHEVLCVVGNVMSNNTSLKTITGEYLEGIGFDMIDVLDFATAYAAFVSELAKSKN